MNFKGLQMSRIINITRSSPVGLILCTVLLTLISVSSYGQQVLSVQDLNNLGSGFNRSSLDKDRLASLMNDSQSAAYFQGGKISYYGAPNPIVLYVDSAQLSSMTSELKNLSRIEMVKIYSKSGNPQVLDKEVVEKLPNLKYIFYVCDNCGTSNMTNTISAFKGLPEEAVVIHNSEKKD